ncbi:hypothetical protein [Burkholderia theae]|uniref:hypothetical protein n=1 Tax=Burkholderia theae TaxID=3143496 RepID=UPI0039F51941
MASVLVALTRPAATFWIRRSEFTWPTLTTPPAEPAPAKLPNVRPPIDVGLTVVVPALVVVSALVVNEPLPSATEFVTFAVDDAPMATALLTEALEELPRATLEVPLAVALAPTAVALVEVAFAAHPSAVAVLPLARLYPPSATAYVLPAVA